MDNDKLMLERKQHMAAVEQLREEMGELKTENEHLGRKYALLYKQTNEWQDAAHNLLHPPDDLDPERYIGYVIGVLVATGFYS